MADGKHPGAGTWAAVAGRPIARRTAVLQKGRPGTAAGLTSDGSACTPLLPDVPPPLLTVANVSARPPHQSQPH